ncbi:MAG: hypothetical protein SOR81_02710 [Fusobacterium sp.]|uniref:hypothetical protein n=1 Tax=Fusobacterium sp. TaxID=68766 RepID=UPI002A75BCF7|nr:hypothetical protein [Fusobacterium sp.]MDY2980499.1 hypothetical protein [Fusobacterium sp.]
MKKINGILTLVETIISSIPFQNFLFGDIFLKYNLNTIYTGTDGLKAQIISTIAGGWFIFGWILSPLFSMLFVFVSLKNGYRYFLENNLTKKIFYLYMCIQSILGIGIYNIQTTISLWIQVGIVLYMFIFFLKIRR